MTDVVRAIRDKTVLKTSSDYIVRDYLHPRDFFQLVSALLASPATNTAVDCYSKAPIEKPKLLHALKNLFGLNYELVSSVSVINSTGLKPYYYSLNKKAADYGYEPSLSSLDGIDEEFRKISKHGVL